MTAQDIDRTKDVSSDHNQSPNTLKLNVTSVNDAPAGADKTVAFAEDGSWTFADSDFGFSDVHDSPANSLLRSEGRRVRGVCYFTYCCGAFMIGETVVDCIIG